MTHTEFSFPRIMGFISSNDFITHNRDIQYVSDMKYVSKS